MDEPVLTDKKIWNLRVIEDPAAENVPAWEMIAAGRYMPRRTRGSFPGRELG
jgi:uroporphyrinogen-III decarboxylase